MSVPSALQTLTLTTFSRLLEIVLEDRGGLLVDDDLAVLDEVGADDGLRVLGEAPLRVVDRLVAERPGEDGSQHHGAGREDDRAQDEKRSEKGQRARDDVRQGAASHGPRRIGSCEGELERATDPTLARWISTSSSWGRRARSRPRGAACPARSSAEAASGSSSTAARARSASSCARPWGWSSCRRSSSRTTTPTTTSACPGC